MTIKELPNKEFASKKEIIDYLKVNKEDIIKIKKLAVKESDGFKFSPNYYIVKLDITKSENQDPDEISVKIVLNTTGYLDSYHDLHVAGLWNKTLSDHANKQFPLLQEHRTSFENVISWNTKTYTQSIAWKDLGYDFEGVTEALVMEAQIKKSENPVMFKAYREGHVTEHSVGMQYVNLALAIKDEDDQKEIDFWNKYYPLIVNKDEADERGYFWVVTEAKLKEGSAVLFGANPITPTLSVEEKSEPPKGTPQNKSKDTQIEPSISEQELIKLLNF